LGPGEEHRGAIVARTVLIEHGPLASGYQSGIWLGRWSVTSSEERLDIRYHDRHIPNLLHQLGFSVKRLRKRLAQADPARRAICLRKTFPALKPSRSRQP